MPRRLRILSVGESGTGKSGSLISLALAGYNIYLLDFDNGSEIIENLLADQPDVFARFHITKLRDSIKPVNGVPKLRPPLVAYKGAGKALVDWNAEAFTDADILVVDTLTKMSEAAFNEALLLAGRLNQRPQLGDYGWMADSVKLYMDMITDDDFGAHVIVNTHIQYLGGDEETQTSSRGLPNAKGKEISKTVATNFNTVLHFRTKGSGPATRRVISTTPQGVVEVKTSAPGKVKPEYSIETGMAELFHDILGHGPSLPAKGSTPAAPPVTQKEPT